jgi:hypothetical protein
MDTQIERMRRGARGSVDLGRSDRAQASAEWIGIVALVAVLLSLAASALGLVPGTALIHSLSRSLLCGASLSKDCLPQGSLERAYGRKTAGLVRDNAPEMLFGPDRLGLPVDFRSCRSPGCAEGADSGEVTTSEAGEPVTLFTRVIERGGSTWIQYWGYYPESASLRGAPVLEDNGYHQHDWESVQVRIGSDGQISQRASSHAGYNHSRSVFNWGSDMGSDLLRGVAETAGLRQKGGWGEATGRWYVAGGSHAGNARDADAADRYPSRTPVDSIRLIPLEQIRGGPLARPADFDPITPPWEKDVWEDPEAEGTG